ncbi:TMV resistance protein N-like isoform X3 [Punica granatum]|uniref:TMV resistance protein N-like isoform X3 n=1 Tax=Punica granatum TaxID=22663 RepID=A0A6P8CFJ6_PUNGR|nr:TMV resistance protein N-like isoform X3 [Punica granatum]
MHDLIRDMGREIVKERCPSNPGKRSRLWFQEDVLLTLQNHLVTEEVEGIALNSPELRTVKVNAEAFVRMNRLRLLRLDNMHFLGHLKVLNLSYSSLLTQNPDYSKLPNLEELILRDCSKLAEVHSSIGCLERLVSLNLKNCKSLIEIPSSICRLKSLKILDISSCPNINWLSEDFGDMVSLTEFLAEGTGITRVPFSATRLTNLMNVSFSVCKEQMTRSISSLIWSLVWPRSASRAKNVQIDCLFQLRSLRTLRLAYCSLSDESIPKEGLGSLQLLENLELSGNWFSSLPDTIRGLLSSRNLYWMIAQISSHFQACPQVLLSCRQLTAYHWKARAIVRLEWCENIAGDAQENFMLGVLSFIHKLFCAFLYQNLTQARGFDV